MISAPGRGPRGRRPGAVLAAPAWLWVAVAAAQSEVPRPARATNAAPVHATVPEISAAAPRGASAAHAGAAPHAPDGEGSYGRWRPARTLPAPERALLRAVRRWHEGRGGHLAYDIRLADAAAGLLDWAHAHAGEPFPLEVLRQAAWKEGWTDGELAAVAVRAPRGRVHADLRRQLQRTLADDVELDQVGLASAAAPDQQKGDPGTCTVVAAFSRRLVHLAPVARRVACGGSVVLSGRSTAPGTRSPTALAQRPDGKLVRVAAEAHGPHFVVRLPAGVRAGVMQVQLLVERGRGPEVAASFPVRVGAASTTAGEGAPSLADDATERDDDRAIAGHHGSLLGLLYGVRAAHGLSLPTPAPRLMQVARAHAEDMAKHHFFAHVSQRTGDVTDRLARAHQPFLHVVENIAEGAGPDQAFAQWLHSPGHRLNLLDPRVDAVGVATVAGGPAAPTVAVLVMAALPRAAR